MMLSCPQTSSTQVVLYGTVSGTGYSRCNGYFHPVSCQAAWRKLSRSLGLGRNNPPYCLFNRHVEAPPEDILQLVSFIMENDCDIHAKICQEKHRYDMGSRMARISSVAWRILRQLPRPHEVDHTQPYCVATRGDLDGEEGDHLGGVLVWARRGPGVVGG